MMKNRLSKGVPVLFVLALVLLAFSAVGSARAAITYYNEDYKARMSASQKLDVVINENGKEIVPKEPGKPGELLTVLSGSQGDVSANNPVVPGTSYPEVLTVTNKGDIDVYARVIIRRYWKDKDRKDNTLSPTLIELNPQENSSWVLDKTASTDERLVYYYTNVLPAVNEENPGANPTSAPLSETIRINPEVEAKVSVKESTEPGKVVTVYDYDGYSFCLEVDVETVQTHNAVDAIKSAWGVDVEINDGKLTPVSAGSGN